MFGKDELFLLHDHDDGHHNRDALSLGLVGFLFEFTMRVPHCKILGWVASYLHNGPTFGKA